MAEPHAVLQQLAQWITPAFYIDLGRPCNSACLYCAVPPHEDAQGWVAWPEIAAMIAAGQACGCDRAILIGGEPTVYPRLFEILALLKQSGLPRDHVMMTNGLRLAEPGLVHDLAAAGIGTVHISVDTADSPTYDRLSRSKGRLAQQWQGLRAALLEPSLQVYDYCALTAINAPTIPGLLRALVDLADKLQVKVPPLILAVAKPIGDALRHADELLIAPADSAQIVETMIELGNSLGVTVGFRNVQACLLPDHVARSVDYYLDDFSVEVASGVREPYSHTAYWHHPPLCEACGHRGICTGIYRDLEKRYGHADFHAIDRQGLRDGRAGG